MENTKKIYIVMTQTGTVLSRIIKFGTGAKYNHVSIGLDKSLDVMYSFGRLRAYNPFLGGFVIESPHYETFKRFYKTTTKILELEVPESKYYALRELINYIDVNRLDYDFNYVGLWLAWFKINLKLKNRFFCSQFVRFALESAEIAGIEAVPIPPKPIDFDNFPDSKCIFEGVLQDYSKENTKMNV